MPIFQPSGRTGLAEHVKYRLMCKVAKGNPAQMRRARAGVWLRQTAVSETAFSYSTNSTVTPLRTSEASSCASQLVRRMQPWELVLPISDGLGVP